MGSVCCCLLADDYEEHGPQTTVVHRYCICLRCLTQQFVNAYTLLFQRGRVYAAPSPVQGTAPLASASLVEDSSISNTYRSPPRPLPYDDPRCSGLQHQRDGPGSRCGKASSHFHEESEPLRRSNNNTDIESTGTTEKWNGSDYGGGSKLCCPESSLNPSKEVINGVTHIFSSSEDEDVCPTCLEEYTSENPRIILQCSHHFHLSCIYEWMERSEACPVCGKVMVFNETT